MLVEPALGMGFLAVSFMSKAIELSDWDIRRSFSAVLMCREACVAVHASDAFSDRRAVIRGYLPVALSTVIAMSALPSSQVFASCRRVSRETHIRC